MITHALHHNAYLDVAKYYHKIWETPSIKEDVDKEGKAVSSSFFDVFIQSYLYWI